MYKKFKNISLLLLGGGLLVYTINVLYHAVIESSKNPIKWEGQAPADYFNLFSKATQQKLIQKGGISFKLRNTISYFSYDNKFDLEVTKLNTKSSLNLQYDIIEAYTKPDGSYSNNNKPENYTDFTTNHNGVSTKFASKIYLSLQGDSVRTILKNDSVACYYLRLKNVYVQYERKGVYEIFIEANAKMYFFTTKKPVSLMFLKRRNSLYFILLTAKGDKNIASESLSHLISNN